MANDPHLAGAVRLLPAEIRSGSAICALNETRSTLVAARIRLALDPWGRLRGLIARRPLADDEGLLLLPCRGIHTWLMRYPIDAVFLDERGLIVGLQAALPPWRMTRIYRNARCVLELAAGTLTASKTEVGDRVLFAPGR